MSFNWYESLHQTASRGDFSRTAALCSLDLDVNKFDEHGRLPIHYAAINGHIDVFHLLVCVGANIHLPDRSTSKSAIRMLFESRSHIDQVQMYFRRSDTTTSEVRILMTSPTWPIAE